MSRKAVLIAPPAQNAAPGDLLYSVDSEGVVKISEDLIPWLCPEKGRALPKKRPSLLTEVVQSLGCTSQRIVGRIRMGARRTVGKLTGCGSETDVESNR